MSLVSIDHEKCNRCTICVQARPLCFGRKGDEIEVKDERSCLLCGHCVSLCPSGAIVHHGMDMDNFKEIGEGMAIGTDDFFQFIRERRTHRHFTDRKIPREDLEKLVDAVRYAPTGHNDQTVEILLLQSPERIKRLSDLTVDYSAALAAQFAAKLEELKASGRGTPEEIVEIEGMMKFRETLVQIREEGYDPVFYNAPAVAIFHSTVRTPTPKDNCVIAATTMGLLARTMGLETTYIALFENASKAYPRIMDELGLPSGNRVFSVLVLGYPKFKYLRTVDRKPIRTRWE